MSYFRQSVAKYRCKRRALGWEVVGRVFTGASCKTQPGNINKINIVLPSQWILSGRYEDSVIDDGAGMLRYYPDNATFLDIVFTS